MVSPSKGVRERRYHQRSISSIANGTKLPPVYAPSTGTGSRTIKTQLGYEGSAEQFGPRQLLKFAVSAEQHGSPVDASALGGRPRHETNLTIAGGIFTAADLRKMLTT